MAPDNTGVVLVLRSWTSLYDLLTTENDVVTPFFLNQLFFAAYYTALEMKKVTKSLENASLNKIKDGCC